MGPDLPCKTSRRKDRGASTLCVTPASHRGGQDNLNGILLPIRWDEAEKYDRIAASGENDCRAMKTRQPLEFSF
jgi:hypothetical protein